MVSDLADAITVLVAQKRLQDSFRHRSKLIPTRSAPKEFEAPTGKQHKAQVAL